MARAFFISRRSFLRKHLHRDHLPNGSSLGNTNKITDIKIAAVESCTNLKKAKKMLH